MTAERLPGCPRPRARDYRLTGIGAFEALFRAGRRRDGRYVQLILAPAARPPGRVGFVIGRKHLRRAVDRNRLKRLLREGLRRARPAACAFDLIIRAKRPLEVSELSLAAQEAAALLAQALAGSRE